VCAQMCATLKRGTPIGMPCECRKAPQVLGSDGESGKWDFNIEHHDFSAVLLNLQHQTLNPQPSTLNPRP